MFHYEIPHSIAEIETLYNTLSILSSAYFEIPFCCGEDLSSPPLLYLESHSSFSQRIEQLTFFPKHDFASERIFPENFLSSRFLLLEGNQTLQAITLSWILYPSNYVTGIFQKNFLPSLQVKKTFLFIYFNKKIIWTSLSAECGEERENSEENSAFFQFLSGLPCFQKNKEFSVRIPSLNEENSKEKFEYSSGNYVIPFLSCPLKIGTVLLFIHDRREISKENSMKKFWEFLNGEEKVKKEIEEGWKELRDKNRALFLSPLENRVIFNSNRIFH
jgi:hypothetical protein